MKISSKYFDKIRIRPKGRKNLKSDAPKCQWNDCMLPGTHKAPLGRDQEGKHVFFCVNHVREYNKTYNYFSGLNNDSIVKLQKDAHTQHLPTWKMGPNNNDSNNKENFQRRAYSLQARARAQARGFRSAYNNSANNTNSMPSGHGQRNRKLKALEKKSFTVLGINPTVSSDQIIARYKELLKRHHPDANGGDRSAEDRLQQIIQSYKILKKAGFC